MAAEDVDMAAGHSKMLAVLVLGSRETQWRVRQVRASVVEKVPNGIGEISTPGVLRLCAIRRCVTPYICEALRSHGKPGQAG